MRDRAAEDEAARPMPAILSIFGRHRNDQFVDGAAEGRALPSSVVMSRNKMPGLG